MTALHNSIDVDAHLIGEIHLASSSFQDNDTEKHWYRIPYLGLLNKQSGNIESSKQITAGNIARGFTSTLSYTRLFLHLCL